MVAARSHAREGSRPKGRSYGVMRVGMAKRPGVFAGREAVKRSLAAGGDSAVRKDGLHDWHLRLAGVRETRRDRRARVTERAYAILGPGSIGCERIPPPRSGMLGA